MINLEIKIWICICRLMMKIREKVNRPKVNTSN